MYTYNAFSKEYVCEGNPIQKQSTVAIKDPLVMVSDGMKVKYVFEAITGVNKNIFNGWSTDRK